MIEALYHYYEEAVGAFRNLSELPLDEAQRIQDGLTGVFASKRNERYLARRGELEGIVRRLFIEKGGQPERITPYYMVVGECPWLETWYRKPAHVRIPVGEFDMSKVSFTYGDMFPTFSDKVTDGMEYRKTVYTFCEIQGIIGKFGMPQDSWHEPVFAQPAYVEVQVWSDEPITRYMNK